MDESVPWGEDYFREALPRAAREPWDGRTLMMQRNATRSVSIGTVTLGADHAIAVQSMTATRTQDVEATARQVAQLQAAGADIIRIAVDSRADVEALAETRRRTTANLAVDLQESYRLAEWVAPHVDKIRYNPGHLYHHERDKPWQEKVRYLVDVARRFDCALRVGVNCGSVDPSHRANCASDDTLTPMLESAREHCDLLDELGFSRYCVSLKDSDPAKVVEVNRRFAEARPDVPLHLGVTEAGLPPEGIVKTRVALEQLIGRGIGDTIRVSLTVPNDQKQLEIEVGRQILADIQAGRMLNAVPPTTRRLNIIACPSCSRVENEAFVELAQRVQEITQYAKDQAITIAVMGCRVNGPGETDDADLGLWCGPHTVNLKRGSHTLGSWPYSDILSQLRVELDRLIADRQAR